MSGESSYRTILRSSSIIGASSFFNILSGLGRMKAAALILGPAGVGLVGMYQNLMQTAATVSSLGFGTSGTRQVALSQVAGSAAATGRARRALFWGTLGLALVGAAIFWSASGWIAAHLLRAPGLRGEVAWLSLGVGLTVASGSQAALLTGLRRIGDVARVQVTSGIIGAAIGILAIWLWGPRGLLVMVLVAPVATFLMGHWYVARLERIHDAPTPLRELAAEWGVMASLGGAFMLSAMVTTLGQLAVRSIMARDLGPEALGQFQASWAIGMTYLAFVLTAMGTDYFPRLTATIPDPAAASRMINEQTEVALLLCAPVVLAMLAAAPWVIRLLYSSQFSPAADILRWQLLGDILKVMSWPLGFALIAAGAGKTFVVTESIGMGVFVIGSALATPSVGVTAAGMAFLGMYVCYLPLVFLLVRRRIGFRWTAPVIRQAVALVLAAAGVAGAARVSNFVSAAVGVPLSLGFGVYGFARVVRMAGADSRLGALARILHPVVTWARRAL